MIDYTAYATVDDVEVAFRTLDADEKEKATALLKEVAIDIDSFAPEADLNKKALVSCRIVRRVLGSGEITGVPLGASQGSMSALGYNQSWTISNGGGTGESYLTKQDKKILGYGRKATTISPVEGLINDD